jgi:hypothetical protein
MNALILSQAEVSAPKARSIKWRAATSVYDSEGVRRGWSNARTGAWVKLRTVNRRSGFESRSLRQPNSTVSESAVLIGERNQLKI